MSSPIPPSTPTSAAASSGPDGRSRPLRRDAAGGKVGGVCAGVADRYDVDPVLVRVAAVLLALSGGLGLVVYLAGWLLLLDEHGRAPVDEHLPAVRRWPKGVLVALAVLACIVVGAALGPFLPFGIAPAVVLALIWYFGAYRRRSRATPPVEPDPAVLPPPVEFARYPGPPTAFTAAAQSWQQRIAEVQRGAVRPPAADPEATTRLDRPVAADPFFAHPDPVGLYAPEPAPSAPVVVPPGRSLPARRLRLGWLLATGLVLAGLGVADAAGAAVPLTGYLAAALLVSGLTLVLAAWCGRARGILPLTVLLVVATVGSGLLGPSSVPHTWGTRSYRYAAGDTLPDRLVLGTGNYQVDLSAYPAPTDETADRTVDIEVDNGLVQLTRPTTGPVRVEWSVGTGAADLPGDDADSGGSQLTGTVDRGRQRAERDGTLTVRVHVDRGLLQVR